MMASKAKGAGQKNVLSDYEMQRIERLKRNADFMKAKGHGTLANKIYQEKAQMHLANFRDVGLSSDEDEDDQDFIGEEASDDNEDQISGNVVNYNMKVSKQLKKSVKCQQNNVGSTIQSSSKPETMADYRNRIEQMHVDPSTKSGSNEKVVEQHERASHQMREKQNRVQQPMTDDVLQPCSFQQPKKQQEKRKFCSPGTMSAYRELRKKQMRNMTGDSNAEQIDLAHEREISCIDASEGGLECELQPGKSKSLTMIEGEATAEELVLQPTTEILTEAPKTKKKRGPTKMTKVHARTLEEHQVIILNKFGQPVGPTQQVVDEFKRFLGTLAKDPERAPLNFVKWPDLRCTEEDKLWEYVLQKYMVPEEGKEWVISKIGVNWRIYKSRTKKKHYYAHKTSEERQNDRPLTISEPQFTQLIKYWDCPKIEEKSKKNRENRQKLDDMHTLGPKSYATLRHQLHQKDPEHQEPSLAKVYMESRKRDPKKTYKINFMKTKDNITQMETLSAQACGEESNWGDPYYDVFEKPEHSGRVRLFGHGVTKSDLKKKGAKSGCVFPQEFVQGIQMDLIEKLQEANPGMSLAIPECFGVLISSDANKAKSQKGNSSGGQLSLSMHSGNQVQQDDFNGSDNGARGHDQLMEE